MSWHYSRALVEEYSEANCSDGELFAPWSSMPSARDDSCSGKMKGICHHSPYGMMYVPSTDIPGRELLTWFLVASPAKILATPATEKGLRVQDLGSGKKRNGSFARYDPATHSLKMSQLSLVGDLEQSLEIWPRWGTMQNGGCFLLVPAVQHKHGKEC